MTCRIGVDPGAVARLMIELRPAQGEHGSLGCVQVVNPKMQVKLHGRGRVWPSRRLMARRSLERQVEACVLALAYRVPVGVRVDHRPPRQPAVELRESGGIAAFQGDSAQLSNTTAHKVNLLDVWAQRCPTLTWPVSASMCPVDTRTDGLPMRSLVGGSRGVGRAGTRSVAERRLGGPQAPVLPRDEEFGEGSRLWIGPVPADRDARSRFRSMRTSTSSAGGSRADGVEVGS